MPADMKGEISTAVSYRGYQRDPHPSYLLQSLKACGAQTVEPLFLNGLLLDWKRFLTCSVFKRDPSYCNIRSQKEECFFYYNHYPSGFLHVSIRSHDLFDTRLLIPPGTADLSILAIQHMPSPMLTNQFLKNSLLQTAIRSYRISG